MRLSKCMDSCELLESEVHLSPKSGASQKQPLMCATQSPASSKAGWCRSVVFINGPVGFCRASCHLSAHDEQAPASHSTVNFEENTCSEARMRVSRSCGFCTHVISFYTSTLHMDSPSLQSYNNASVQASMKMVNTNYEVAANCSHGWRCTMHRDSIACQSSTAPAATEPWRGVDAHSCTNQLMNGLCPNKVRWNLADRTWRVRAPGAPPFPSRADTFLVLASKYRQKASPPIPTHYRY